MASRLDGFETETLDLAGRARAVFTRGAGPAVVVVAEVPGITPAVAHLARTVANAGFRVYMPVLFGVPGAEMTGTAVARTMAHVCISREFHILAADHSSPVVDWLRALARHAHGICGGPGVGFIGMCLTGNFGIAMMLDAPVIAPVLCQPSLPIGLLPCQRAALHASPAELAAAHDKIEHEGARLLGLRFIQDFMSPPARFERLRQEFGDAFEAIQIDARHARPGTGMPAHSPLTTHLIDRPGEPTRAALDRTLAFLAERLKPAA